MRDTLNHLCLEFVGMNPRAQAGCKGFASQGLTIMPMGCEDPPLGRPRYQTSEFPAKSEFPTELPTHKGPKIGRASGLGFRGSTIMPM